MKRLLVCLAAAAALTVAAGPARAADDLKGTYGVSQGGVKVTIAFDGAGKFTVKSKDDVLVVGTYALDKDQVTFTDTDGPAAIKDKGPGKYKWAIKDKKLTFTKVEDGATGRAEALTAGPWAAE